jgi:hypothetical protein
MSIHKSKFENAVETAKREETAKNVTVNNAMTTEAILEKFDFADMEQVDAKHKNMNSIVKGSGCVTVINHDKCGRRLHLSNKIWCDLGYPRYLKLFIKPNQLFLVADENSGVAVKFDRTMDFEKAVQSYNGKIVLYATETVKRLTTDWNLEFDSNCCYTGGTFKKCLIGDKSAIVISKEETVVSKTTEEVNNLQSEN